MKKYLALFLVISSLALVGCTKAPEVKEKPIAVSVQMAKGGEIENTNTFIGTTKVREEISVTAEMSGTIQEIYVTLGQQVKKGDKLLAIKGDDLQNSVKQAQAALDIAKASYTNSKNSLSENLKTAQRNYDEAKRSHDAKTQLYQAQAISEDEFKRSQASFDQAKQSLDMAQKSYDEANGKSVPELEDLAQKQLNQAQVAYDIAASNLRKLTLITPVDGIITAKNFDSNELINQQQPAFIISTPNILQIDLEVTQSDLSKFEVGKEVEVTVKDKKVKGTIKYVPEVTTGNTSLYDIQIIVDNSEDEFKAGMSAEVKLSIEKEASTVTIPKKAIFEDAGKKYIYLVSGDNKTVKTEVITGILTEKSAEIKSGVKKDDTVVIGGLNLISDGTLVFPVTKEG